MRAKTGLSLLIAAAFVASGSVLSAQQKHEHHKHGQHKLDFSIQSVANGDWSNPKTWRPARTPKAGDRVLISRGTRVRYDAKQPDVIRLVQVVGTLSFARDRDTELNVGVLTIPHVEHCSEQGFACEFEGADSGPKTPDHLWPTLLIGTSQEPIPAKFTARIRLHYLDGMNKADAPALACCSGRMEIHGSPMRRNWVKLAKHAEAGDDQVVLDLSPLGDDEKQSEPVDAKSLGWRVGDEVIVTASSRASGGGSFRRDKEAHTEPRTITAIDGAVLMLDKPLRHSHLGEGEFRAEVANLSRNVIIESADPEGVRGHTVYHAFSRGGISYARFAHLGKEGVLGRYAIHYHLVGDTMRGSAVRGAAIVDSHNRWITIHGAQYLVVRDCIGYKSVGHGYFMEDGSEVYNLLDRNLAVHAYTGRRLPKQVLPFDPNDGAGFWWANGRNTITRNVTVENDEYGYRYDMQHSRYFDARLPILQPDGGHKKVDVRTIPIWRFEDNEAHAEGFYGMVVAANGGSQPDNAIRDQKMLERIKRIDWTGPDTQHPHIIRNLAIWGSHYAFRPHSPAMLMENVRLHDAAYGVYRPAFENHVYRNLNISKMGAEPFNRGMDDASAQTGPISVDGLTFTTGYGNRSTPLVQISDVNISGDAETHFRNVKVNRPEQFADRWPLINRGVGPRVKPITKGVPIFIHDYFGPGRHAKVVSTAAEDLIEDGNKYVAEPPLTGNESRVAEVADVAWPKLLDPQDDLPPATTITSWKQTGERLIVEGISHDNGRIVSVIVNGRPARIVASQAGVVDWRAELDAANLDHLTAHAEDAAGNVERYGHQTRLSLLPQ